MTLSFCCTLPHLLVEFLFVMEILRSPSFEKGNTRSIQNLLLILLRGFLYEPLKMGKTCIENLPVHCSLQKYLLSSAETR